MRITRDWAPARYPIHLCLLDRECWRGYREFYAPMRLYLHFLLDKRGHRVFINVWGVRRHDRWFEQVFANGDFVANRSPNAGDDCE